MAVVVEGNIAYGNPSSTSFMGAYSRSNWEGRVLRIASEERRGFKPRYCPCLVKFSRIFFSQFH